MKSLTRLSWAAFAMALAITLTACGGGNTPELTQVDASKTITVLRADKSENLDPQATDSGGDVTVLMQMYETLVRPSVGTANVEWEPGLAKSWTINDDKSVYTFVIRDGVTFHDGTKLDAAAVKRSLDRLVDENEKSKPVGRPYRKGFFGGVTSISTDGDKVIINFYNFGEVTQITATLDDEGRLEEWIEDSGLERYYYYNSQGYLEEMESYNPDDDDESFTIYYTVANGNVVSAIQEFEDGSIGTVAYTYYSDKVNKDGILHFETDGILHMGFNRQGKASKNLLKSEVRTSPDQEVRRWDMTYVLQTDGYVSQRNAEYTNVDINWTFVQNFQYNCQ